MKKIVEFNKLKRLELINKIINCNGKYTLLCIDVDDVIFNTEPYVQDLLEQIDYRATKKYREEVASESSEDAMQSMKRHYKILNAILEETVFIDYDDRKDRLISRNYKQLDYGDIYQDKNLFMESVEYIRNILTNRDKNTFVIFISHRNPEREGIIKMERLYELFPEVDAIETIPFHEEKGSDIVNSKALYIKEVYALDSLENCILIDNSRGNCLDFRKHGGMDIRYLPQGFSKKHKLSDHLSKISNLDPTMFQFVISYINYARENPEYIDEVDIPLENTSSKIKKLRR